MRWPWRGAKDNSREWLVANQAKIESLANKKLIAQLVKSDRAIAELRAEMESRESDLGDEIDRLNGEIDRLNESNRRIIVERDNSIDRLERLLELARMENTELVAMHSANIARRQMEVAIFERKAKGSGENSFIPSEY
jgi:hypothetical protein